MMRPDGSILEYVRRRRCGFQGQQAGRRADEIRAASKAAGYRGGLSKSPQDYIRDIDSALAKAARRGAAGTGTRARCPSRWCNNRAPTPAADSRG
jgi:hypothetical protein